ncbi:uncharacterized protein LOC135817120 [Sycon ciliatum]|uniref:uncharacterized protein LOC135817120 n=1 Tax=Sycon ciliatum TaxID=27933 RepID=UPI0020AB134C|eukprot:scpid41276/ scgid15277/ 
MTTGTSVDGGNDVDDVRPQSSAEMENEVAGGLRPPTPDFSIFTPAERQHIVSVLKRLKQEEEAEMQRRRNVQQELDRTYASPDSEDTDYVDVATTFEVCESCNLATTCHATQQVNSEETIYMCAACMKRRKGLSVTGRWYNGVDMDEMLNTCNQLLEKAGALDPAAVEKPSPSKVRTPSPTTSAAATVVDNTERNAVVEEPEVIEPVTAVEVEPVPEPEAVPSEPVKDRDEVDGGQPSAVVAGAVMTPLVAAMQERPAEQEDPGDIGAASQADNETEEPEDPDTPMEDDFQLGPGQVMSDTGGFEEVGKLQMVLHLGADGPDKIGLIVDVKRGMDLSRWQNVGSKPGFSIYVKCYLVFPNMPEKSVKMKTSLVLPSASPTFDDQMIPVMSKQMMKRAQYLRVQLWEHNGKLRKNIAVGTASIDIQSLDLENKGPITGVYALMKPGKAVSGVVSPYASLRASRQPPASVDGGNSSAHLSTQVDPQELRERLETV